MPTMGREALMVLELHVFSQGMGMPRGIAAAVRIIRIHALRQGAPASGRVAEALEKRSTFAHNSLNPRNGSRSVDV
jgi:hypothetical protein